MPGRFVFIILFFIHSAGNVWCNDLIFVWRVYSFPSHYYRVEILKETEKQYSIRYFTTSNRAKDSARILTADVIRLENLINQYTFPVKGNTYTYPDKYTAAKVISLPDTAWVLYESDSVRRELLFLRDVYFLPDSGGYYKLFSGMNISWTDGSGFSGEWFTKQCIKSFDVYGTRTSDADFMLNLFMYGLVIKYFDDRDFTKLFSIIYENAPTGLYD